MRQIFSIHALLLTCALILPHPAPAQLLQGAIDGNVADPTQAAVAGAKVVATSEQANFTRDTIANSSGGYTLPPGAYTIRVTAPGFQSYTQSGVQVAINTVTRVDLTLTLGQVSETLTVTAQTGILQTDHADVRTDMTTQALNSLPVPLGRNYQMLLPVMVPGVATPVSGGSFRRQSVPRRAGGLQRRQRMGQQHPHRRRQFRLQRNLPHVHSRARVHRDR